MYRVLLLINLFVFVTSSDFHPDAGLDVVQLAMKHGYEIQSHEVETQDGYILTLHHILNKNRISNRPVLVMHGLLSSSADFVNIGPRKALALLLADNMYDVWLGNQRGNTWSRKHRFLNPDQNQAEFFNFSFHEIGMYDLPAMIDYILDYTHQEKLFYIGHSQGTTSFFVMGSEKPEYNNKIKLMVALAPVVYMNHIPNNIFQLVSTDYYEVFDNLVRIFEIHEIFRHTGSYREMAQTFCTPDSEYEVICTMAINMMVGFNDQLDAEFTPVMFTSFPAGAAIKQIQHFLQGIASANFSRFDFGSDKNLEYYNQETPPLYDITRVTAPVSLYYTVNDFFAHPTDVQRLESELPNRVTFYKISMDKFNHLDFLFARDVAELLYKDVIAEMNSVE